MRWFWNGLVCVSVGVCVPAAGCGKHEPEPPNQNVGAVEIAAAEAEVAKEEAALAKLQAERDEELDSVRKRIDALTTEHDKAAKEVTALYKEMRELKLPEGETDPEKKFAGPAAMIERIRPVETRAKELAEQITERKQEEAAVTLRHAQAVAAQEQKLKDSRGKRDAQKAGS
jgi:hypothetical protein